jgi:hypothetical protein
MVWLVTVAVELASLPDQLVKFTVLTGVVVTVTSEISSLKAPGVVFVVVAPKFNCKIVAIVAGVAGVVAVAGTALAVTIVKGLFC